MTSQPARMRRAAPASVGHQRVLSKSEDRWSRTVAEWVRQALECGEMVICSAAFPAFESASLAAVLCDVGIDADVALAEARLSVLPSTEVYRNPGPVGLGHGAAARPEDRVRDDRE
jgi:hypothetical protein